MKRILLPLLFITVASVTPVHTSAQEKKPAAKSEKKYSDNVDDRMKGPHGEKIYIGEKGGRYYLTGGKKVYVEYKGNKKKKEPVPKKAMGNRQ